MFMKIPQIYLGPATALILYRQSIPSDRFLIILGHALAVMIHNPQVVRGPSIPLLRGKAIPPNRFVIILRYASPKEVHIPQAVLGRRIALVRQGSQFFQSGVVVATLVGFFRRLKFIRVLGRDSHIKIKAQVTMNDHHNWNQTAQNGIAKSFPPREALHLPHAFQQQDESPYSDGSFNYG